MKLKSGDYFIDGDNDIGLIIKSGYIWYTYKWILIDGKTAETKINKMNIKDSQKYLDWAPLDEERKARLI